MSALELVLPRQAPTRLAGKFGDLGSGDSAGDQSPDHQFSAILWGEKRNAAMVAGAMAGRGDQDLPANSVVAEPQAADPFPGQAPADASAQSDEMLALLEGLMSSAAFSDDVTLGAAGDVAPAADSLDQALPSADIDTAIDVATKPDIDLVTNTNTNTNTDTVGASAIVPNRGAVSVGASAIVASRSAVSVGASDIVASRGSVSVGDSAIVASRSAVSVGDSAIVASRGAVSVGDSAIVASRGAVSVGASDIVANRGAVSVGDSAIVASRSAVSVGASAIVASRGAVSVGASATVASRNAVSVGDSAIVASRGLGSGRDSNIDGISDIDTERDPDPDTTQTTAAVAVDANRAAGTVVNPAVAVTQPAQTAGAAELAARTGNGDQPPGKNARARAVEGSNKATIAEKGAIHALRLNEQTPSVKSDQPKSAAADRFAGADDLPARDDRQLDERIDPKPRNVEVLDSRRFVAVQPLSANGQMLSRLLIDAGQPAFGAQRAAPAQSVAVPGQPQPGQTLHTLKLQLNPVSLGSVTAVLKLTGENLSVDIRVETVEAYRQLSDDNQAILKALRTQGYGVEQITVQYVAAPERPPGHAPQPGFQPGSPGTGSGDAHASGREPGGQGAREQGKSQNEGQGREQNPYAGSGVGSGDGVYL